MPYFPSTCMGLHTTFPAEITPSVKLDSQFLSKLLITAQPRRQKPPYSASQRLQMSENLSVLMSSVCILRKVKYLNKGE